MNSALLAAQRLACLEQPVSIRSSVRKTLPAKRARQSFPSYFVEQSIALLATWLQQVILAWLTHGAVHGPQILSAVNPQLGAVINTVCSAFTWLLLTVWTFKLRERFRRLTIAFSVVKANLSTIVRLCLLNWARKGHRHCS